MKNKISLVMQGPLTEWTEPFIRRYQQNPLIEQVIFSSWDGTPEINGIINIRQPLPANQGKGNRNCQILSSQAGLKLADSLYSIKVRSDMFVDNLEDILSFYNKQPCSILALSIYPRFLFHPRDHFFFGYTEELGELFNIPLDPDNNTGYDEHNDTRTEGYIGCHYYSKYNVELRKAIQNMDFLYLCDKYKNLYKSLFDFYHNSIDNNNIIGVIPRTMVKLDWPKHWNNNYPYDYLRQVYGECFYEDIISGWHRVDFSNAVRM